MLLDKVWASITTNIHGMLCMDCCESKLGRPLKKEDIKDCPISYINDYTAGILKNI